MEEEFNEWWEEKFVPDNLHLNDIINDDSVWSSLKSAARDAWAASRMTREERMSSMSWDIELMYKHRGERKPRFIELGRSFEEERDDALEEGKEKALDWLSQFRGNQIESWEVKVRPAKR